MPTEAEKKALDYLLTNIKGSPEYYNHRAQCMSGFQAQSTRLAREKNIPQPDAGVLCLELLKHSADVEGNPAAKAARPDQELLGPYKAISADKGFQPSEANAQMLLNMYSKVAELPNIAPLSGAVKIPNGNPPVDFYLTQGSALDTAFTKTVLDAYAGKPTPAPTGNKSAAELAALTDACFRNKDITIGQCTEVGKEQAAVFLQTKQKVAASR